MVTLGITGIIKLSDPYNAEYSYAIRIKITTDIDVILQRLIQRAGII